MKNSKEKGRILIGISLMTILIIAINLSIIAAWRYMSSQGELVGIFIVFDTLMSVFEIISKAFGIENFEIIINTINYSGLLTILISLIILITGVYLTKKAPKNSSEDINNSTNKLVIELTNGKTGATKKAPTGFSWTTLIFGFFTALMRLDFKWALRQLLLAVFTCGMSVVVFPFIYNKLYIKKLLSKGYTAHKEEDIEYLTKKRLVSRKEKLCDEGVVTVEDSEEIKG